MSRSIIATSYPSAEIVALSDMYNFVKGFPGTDDTFLGSLIPTARAYVEDRTGWCLAPRNFVQYCDHFPGAPFVPNSFAPLAGVALPYFGTGPMGFITGSGFTPRRNPAEIQLWRNPVQPGSTVSIAYTDAQGNPQTLTAGTDFVVDYTSEPARVSPMPGATLQSMWPAITPGPKAVAISFTAGFSEAAGDLTDTEPPVADTVPPIFKLLIMNVARHMYLNRDGQPVPEFVNDLIFAERITDFNPGIE